MRSTHKTQRSKLQCQGRNQRQRSLSSKHIKRSLPQRTRVHPGAPPKPKPTSPPLDRSCHVCHACFNDLQRELHLTDLASTCSRLSQECLESKAKCALNLLRSTGLLHICTSPRIAGCSHALCHLALRLEKRTCSLPGPLYWNFSSSILSCHMKPPTHAALALKPRRSQVGKRAGRTRMSCLARRWLSPTTCAGCTRGSPRAYLDLKPRKFAFLQNLTQTFTALRLSWAGPNLPNSPGAP